MLNELQAATTLEGTIFAILWRLGEPESCWYRASRLPPTTGTEKTLVYLIVWWSGTLLYRTVSWPYCVVRTHSYSERHQRVAAWCSNSLLSPVLYNLIIWVQNSPERLECICAWSLVCLVRPSYVTFNSTLLSQLKHSATVMWHSRTPDILTLFSKQTLKSQEISQSGDTLDLQTLWFVSDQRWSNQFGLHKLAHTFWCKLAQRCLVQVYKKLERVYAETLGYTRHIHPSHLSINIITT